MATNPYLNQLYNAAAQQNTLGAIGGALGAYGNTQWGLQGQQYYDPYMTTSTWTTTATMNPFNMEYLQEKLERATKPLKKAWKKTNNLLVDLRHEIDEWHGDILRAA